MIKNHLTYRTGHNNSKKEDFMSYLTLYMGTSPLNYSKKEKSWMFAIIIGTVLLLAIPILYLF
jgi:hypothetical protein